MQMTFRWYGPGDPVPLRYIRQIPGVAGVVSALHDVLVGEAWTREDVAALRASVEEAGLKLSVIESIPVHEEIKLGGEERDRYIEHYQQSLDAVGAEGVRVVCYNFMPVFDWTRTDLAYRLEDGSTALRYDHTALEQIDLSGGTGDLPGWGAAYTADELRRLRARYAKVDPEQLWEHLAYFLEQVVPVAEASGVRLALHPDDPPWPIFGLPRIITSVEALERVTRLAGSPANGICLCTGSLGADPATDLPAAVYRLKDHLHFVHLRNVRVTGGRQFHESPHPARYGSVDLVAVMEALCAVGYGGPARPDHGRMIWDEAEDSNARPGYGLYDRALGATYLVGLWDAFRYMSVRTAYATHDPL